MSMIHGRKVNLFFVISGVGRKVIKILISFFRVDSICVKKIHLDYSVRKFICGLQENYSVQV